MNEVLKSSRFWICAIICLALFGLSALGKLDASVAVSNMVFLATGFSVGKAGGSARLDKLVEAGVSAALGKDKPDA